MYAVFKLTAEELDEGFVESIKRQFRGRQIEISVCESAGEEADETSYLLQSETNRERLLAAVANVEAGRNLVPVSLENLE